MTYVDYSIFLHEHYEIVYDSYCKMTDYEKKEIYEDLFSEKDRLRLESEDEITLTLLSRKLSVSIVKDGGISLMVNRDGKWSFFFRPNFDLTNPKIVTSFVDTEVFYKLTYAMIYIKENLRP